MKAKPKPWTHTTPHHNRPQHRERRGEDMSREGGGKR